MISNEVYIALAYGKSIKVVTHVDGLFSLNMDAFTADGNLPIEPREHLAQHIVRIIDSITDAVLNPHREFAKSVLSYDPPGIDWFIKGEDYDV